MDLLFARNLEEISPPFNGFDSIKEFLDANARRRQIKIGGYN